MDVILFIFLALIIVLALLLLLPVRLSVYVAGDMFDGFMLDGRLHVFNGLVGGGIETDGSRVVGRVFLLFRRIVEFDLSGLFGYIMKKTAGRTDTKVEKKKKPAPQKPLVEKLKSLRGNMGKGKIILRELKGMFRLDHVKSHVNLGLLRPEATGLMTGVIFAVNGILPKRYEIVPRWDFTANALSGDLQVRFTVINYIFWIKLLTILPKVLADGSATRFMRQVKQRYA